MIIANTADPTKIAYPTHAAVSYFTNKLNAKNIVNDKVIVKANMKIAGLNIFLPRKAKNTPITTKTVVKIIGLFSMNLKS